MSWISTETSYGRVIRNENGAELGIGGDVPVIEQDGYAFKDLARTGELLPYEDWRLTPEERAKDLAGRLSREEVAGLMLYSSHQIVPFRSRPPFSDTYGGEPFDPAKHGDADLTDGQISMLKNDHIRHVLQMRVKNARVSAMWSNNLQKVCEAERWGIPVNISTDPRHGASAGGAEFRTAGSDVSKWPEGIGLAAAGDPEMVREVLDVILGLAAEGKTMLIVTHEMQFARAVADRVIFLDDGRICEEGTPEQFFDAPRTERARQFLKTFTYERNRKRE